MSDHYPYDAFISYSSQEKDWVRSILLPGLEEAGLRCLIDFRDFEPGAPSVSEMERAVKRAQHTILVITPSYISSNWCHIEHIMVHTLENDRRERRIIPLRRVNCEMPLYLAALTHIDFTDNADSSLAWFRLLTVAGAQPAHAPLLEGRHKHASLDATGHKRTGDDGPSCSNGELPEDCLLVGLPHSSPFFVGRDAELQHITDALKQYRRVSMHGMPGIGKSALASTVCRSLYSSYNPIIWIDARSQTSLNKSLLRVARELNISPFSSDDQSTVIKQVRYTLAHLSNPLIIFDAADDSAPRIELGPGSRVLTTTRNAHTDPCFFPVKIGYLSEAESALYLLRRTAQIDIREQHISACDASVQRAAIRLASKLQCFPLALECAAVFIATTSCSFSEYMELLDKHDVLHEPQALQRTYKLVIDTLRKRFPAAYNVLCISSFLDYAHIPEELIVNTSLRQSHLYDAIRDGDGILEVRRALSRFSLFEREPATRVISLNRVILSYVRQYQSDKEKNNTLSHTLAVLNAIFPSPDPDNWHACERYLSHAIRCCEWAKRLRLDGGVLRDLALKIVDYFTERARFEEADQISKLVDVSGSQTQYLSEDHNIHYLVSRGLIEYGQGQYNRALLHFQKAKDRISQGSFPLGPKTATITVNLAAAYDRLGEYDKALTLFQHALRIMRNFRTTPRKDIANCLNGIAAALYGSRRYGEAKVYFLEVLSSGDPLLSRDTIEKATALCGLASISESENKLSEAEAYLRKCLAMRRALLPFIHPVIGATLLSLGIVTAKQKRYADTRLYLREARDIYEKTLGGKHPEVDVCIKLCALFRCDLDDENHVEHIEEVRFQDKLIAILAHHGADKSTRSSEIRKYETDAPVATKIQDVTEDSSRAAKEQRFRTAYRRSIEEPEAFWAEHGRSIDWMRPFTKVGEASFTYPDVYIRWYVDGTLNISLNCLDRHLDRRANQVALLWEGDENGVSEHFTYGELHAAVCRCGSALRSLGVSKGDRVTLYMPMIPELPIAMLACSRIGAIHSVVFSDLTEDELAFRIRDSGSMIVVTVDEAVRGGCRTALKSIADDAILSCPSVRHCVIVRRTGGAINWTEGRDVWWSDVVDRASAECLAEEMGAEDGLFILYASSSSGLPKGLLHTSGGYIVYVSMTYRHIFDYREGDIYWCTADIASITGHSYVVYGPLSNGATTIIYEGIPGYSNTSRFLQTIEKYDVTIFHTEPSILRILMSEGEEAAKRASREFLRVLGSFGETIHPEEWLWYRNVVGAGRCEIVNCWSQTETGGVLLSTLPFENLQKPGSLSMPLFGVKPVVVDREDTVVPGEGYGLLCLTDAWPGIARTVYGNHEVFVNDYFLVVPGVFFTGDVCSRDVDGYYWITERADDVIKVSGRRIGVGEVEAALVQHPKVAEAVVVGYPHDLKGQGIYAYVTPNVGERPDDALRVQLVSLVHNKIGAFATPDLIEWAGTLPKTRSGKILRQVLREIAKDDFHPALGHNTAADPAVISQMIEMHLHPLVVRLRLVNRQHALSAAHCLAEVLEKKNNEEIITSLLRAYSFGIRHFPLCYDEVVVIGIELIKLLKEQRAHKMAMKEKSRLQRLLKRFCPDVKTERLSKI